MYRPRFPYSSRKSYYRRPRPQDMQHHSRPYFSSSSSRRSLVQRVPASLPRIEYKSVDVDLAMLGAPADGGLTTTMSRNAVFCPVLGTDFSNRIGRQVTLRSVQLHMTVTADADQTAPVWFRYMLVYDRQNNGAQPAATDILVAGTPYSPKNLSNRERFSILRDITSSVIAGAVDKATYEDNWYRKLNHPVTFNAGVAGTYADIQSGCLWMCYVSTVAVDYPLAKGFLRIRYTDD